MRTDQAKAVPMIEILAALGHQPVKQSGGEWFYFSPLRQETDASFAVRPSKNVWYDHGTGNGGNVIDFVMHYFDLAGVADALRKVEALAGLPAPVAVPPAPVSPTATTAPVESGIALVNVQRLRHRALFDYLHSRGLSAALALPFVQEAYYRVAGRERTYFALAFPNAGGGYELRNKYFQGVAGRKDISLIQEDDMAGMQTVMVFEGFIDFLSALAHYGTPAPTVPVIVLNSVTMKEKALAAIRELRFQEVQLYLDRDDAGIKLAADFRQALPGLAVIDRSPLYRGYKDVNAWWTARQKTIHTERA